MDANKTPDSDRRDARTRVLDKNQPSLSSLILWNVSKALENHPNIDLRCAMKSAVERMEHHAHDVNDLVSQYPEERHIACAVLAWQQLGHRDTESLYEFIESNRNKILRNTSENSSRKENIYSVNSSDTAKRPKGFIDHKPSVYRNGVDSASFDTCSLIGPVVKLPVETKVVMRVENTTPCARHGAKKTPKNDVKKKVDALNETTRLGKLQQTSTLNSSDMSTLSISDDALHEDSACVERLKEMERATGELRARAARLARREAERAELLERAEAAWRDLELGYQRRLLLAEEKEEDIAKQIKKSIEDRNAYKHACTVLAQQLGKRGDIVENDRAHLTQLEREVCDLACTRLQLSDEAAKGDAAVADQQCRTVQLERDLQFKEEQARRKLLTIESVMDSSRGLTLEAERAMRGELGSVKEQIVQISNQLLEWEADNNRIKTELDELRKQKMEMFEDLEGCKQMCDNRMQGAADDLNKKRQILNELKEKAIECQCKLPFDAAVEVKRTPSLAALCRCPAEEHILHSCSCTSVRSTLLSNLLSDLFGGLQAELGDTGSLMPCQLLKCLEDKHNWDRASIVKSNLRSFFSRLLVGELDTAIATSIEKYHATWVGVSCADKCKMIPEPGEVESEGWQERALERRAQKLAGQLAEQLFQERADQLVQRAKDIVTSGPPPCECRPQSNKATAYPCLVKPPTIGGAKRNETNYPTYIKKTLQDVTLLRTQVEDLKKKTIKKEDLRMMEEKITKLVQQSSGPDNTDVFTNKIAIKDGQVKQKSMNRSMNTEDRTEISLNNSSFVKKKSINTASVRKNCKRSADFNGKVADGKLAGKTLKKMDQSYAVNLCLFDGKKKPNDCLQNMTCSNDLNIWKEKISQNRLSQIPSIKHSRPIDKMISKNNYAVKTKKRPSNIACKCFHRVPSNTSIDKLLETLLKWKGDILNYSVFKMTPSILENTKRSNTNIKEIHHNSEFSNNKISINISDVGALSQNITQSVKYTDINHLPPTTTSEYIGAINLDKSNEHVCKCNTNLTKKNKLKHESDVSSKDNLLFKCFNTSKCSCKRSGHKKQNENGDKAQASIKSLDKNINIMALTDIKQLYDENNISNGKQNDIVEHKSVTALIHKNNQTSDSNIIPKERDALVRFLGVTLTDLKKSKASTVGKKNKKCDKINGIASALKHKVPGLYSKVATSLKCDNQKHSSDIKIGLLESEYESKTNICKFMDLYNNTDDTINNCKDELKDNQCLGEVMCDRKSCVCCNYDDETKNLEVNTFCLLEKHLKHKLAEFKKISGKSTCILPHEEEKVFITLLDKVKQVICNCTYNMKCECSVSSNKSGSWVRFNNLLEEYLKIKIKRAQCTCIPNKDSVETILPNVLEQVSNLIENDFERLKNLCEIRDSNKIGNDKKIHDDYEAKNNIEIAELQCSQPLEKCISFENVSIQGSYKLQIENKSCIATEIKDTKNIQTSINQLSLESHSVEVIISHCCNLHNRLPSKIGVNKNVDDQSIMCKDNLCTVQKKSSSVQNINKEADKTISSCSLRVPYIGYTLSCSCDKKLGSCICSKSISHSCVKNIDNIWKMLEINKKPNLSYIMHSIPKRARSEDRTVNFVDLAKTSLIPLIQESHDVKNVTASDGEEIILKASEEKVKLNAINDNMTSTVDELVSVKTECYDDDVLYWYDCSPSPHDVNNEIMLKKSLYDSIYTPLRKLPKHGKSETSIKNITSVSKSHNCDCVRVPICHVKMLVENIESKLVNSQCTCDSLSAQVCPFHSKAL